VPVFRTKKEAYDRLRSGKKIMDVRKGKPIRGQIAVYLSGRKVLRLKIVRSETGSLHEIVRMDNFRLIVPSSDSIDNAVSYVEAFYLGYSGVFTAYYVEPLSICGKC
jgi:hypothetical protein